MSVKSGLLLIALLTVALNYSGSVPTNPNKPWQSAGHYYIGDFETSEENYLIELEAQENARDAQIKQEVDRALNQAITAPLKKLTLLIIGIVGAKYLIKCALLEPTSDCLISYIARRQVQKFQIGFGIGVVHGMINQSLKNLYQSEKETVLSLYPIATYIAASKFERTCLGAYQSSDALWGRGIGQFLAESIELKSDKDQGRIINFDFVLNWSLIKAFFR